MGSEQRNVAYVGQKPWHNDGVEVNPASTVDEWMEAAKMNWMVKRHQLAMRDANGNMLTKELEGFRAIVRSDTNAVFCIPTNKYQIVQNREIVEMFKEYCEAGHAALETIGTLREGAVVWALARLNGGSTATIGKSDEVRGYLLMTTSHDGSISTIGKATQVRVVCQNTLSAALTGKAEFKMKHSTKFTAEKRQQAQDAMGMALEQVKTINAVAQKLSNVKFEEKDRVEFVTRLLGGESILEQVVSNHVSHDGGSILDSIIENQNKAVTAQATPMAKMGRDILDAMLNSPGAELDSAKDTLWGAINGVSYYTDHMRGRTSDSRLGSSWFGASNDLKQQAMSQAIELAGITVTASRA